MSHNAKLLNCDITVLNVCSKKKNLQEGLLVNSKIQAQRRQKCYIWAKGEFLIHELSKLANKQNFVRAEL